MIPLLEAFIQYVGSHQGVEFKTLEELARKYQDDPAIYEPEGAFV